jgi:hypothetical protein
MKQYRKASRGKLHGLFSIVVDQHTIFISLRVFTNMFAVDYLKDSSFLSPRPVCGRWLENLKGVLFSSNLPCFQFHWEVALELGLSLSRNCYNLLVYRELIASWCLYLVVGKKRFLTMAGIKKI